MGDVLSEVQVRRVVLTGFFLAAIGAMVWVSLRGNSVQSPPLQASVSGVNPTACSVSQWGDECDQKTPCPNYGDTCDLTTCRCTRTCSVESGDACDSTHPCAETGATCGRGCQCYAPDTDPFCGDGDVDPAYEECDGANDPSAGGCPAGRGCYNCRCISQCGNGVVDAGEACDYKSFTVTPGSSQNKQDPNNVIQYVGCPADLVCKSDCSGCVTNNCGDGSLSQNEDCDPACVSANGLACAATPTANPSGATWCTVTGQNVAAVPTTCRSDCTCSACGNGRLEDGEECDINQVCPDSNSQYCTSDGCACSDVAHECGLVVASPHDPSNTSDYFYLFGTQSPSLSALPWVSDIKPAEPGTEYIMARPKTSKPWLDPAPTNAFYVVSIGDTCLPLSADEHELEDLEQSNICPTVGTNCSGEHCALVEISCSVDDDEGQVSRPSVPGEWQSLHVTDGDCKLPSPADTFPGGLHYDVFRCPGGCVAGVCLQSSSSSSNSSSSRAINQGICTDTDGGQNYTQKGTVSFQFASAATVSHISDYCMDNHRLMEVSCLHDNGPVKTEVYTCPGMCQAGACKDTTAVSRVSSSVQASSVANSLCGNGILDPGEQCESDADCTDVAVCSDCLCKHGQRSSSSSAAILTNTAPFSSSFVSSSGVASSLGFHTSTFFSSSRSPGTWSNCPADQACTVRLGKSVAGLSICVPVKVTVGLNCVAQPSGAMCGNDECRASCVRAACSASPLSSSSSSAPYFSAATSASSSSRGYSLILPTLPNYHPPVCGDGVLQQSEDGEQCDDGPGNAALPDHCRPNCKLPRCGDGIQDTGEQCDDGNQVDHDTCTNTCMRPRCGDGILQPGEECDYGSENSNDDYAICRKDCTYSAFALSGAAYPAAPDQSSEMFFTSGSSFSAVFSSLDIVTGSGGMSSSSAFISSAVRAASGSLSSIASLPSAGGMAASAEAMLIEVVFVVTGVVFLAVLGLILFVRMKRKG